MTKYELKMLNTLIDKYERSKSFVGSNQVAQNFVLKIEQLFPKYADDAEYDLFCSINESVRTLVAKGLVKENALKNGVIQKITLNLDSLEDAYHYLGRTPKVDIVDDLRRILNRYKTSNEILGEYCLRQLARLEQNKPVDFFDNDMSAFESILKVVSEITKVENELFERDFSIRVLGDSKEFGKIRTKVVSLLDEYGDFPDKETILADLNIVKNPGHIYFKGNGRISICGQPIDFSKMIGDIAISSVMLNCVDAIEVFGSTIVTIENLTSFNAFRCKDSFAIYLGGYHNKNRRDFIAKVYNQNPDKQYLHFGDIDAGGFYILEHLRKRTGIPFAPYHMNVQTLKENLQYTKRLTAGDKSRLRALVDTEFGETVQFMLENDCKLEQEAMDLNGVGI